MAINVLQLGCFKGFFFRVFSVYRNSVSALLPKLTETPFRLNYRTEPKFRSNTRFHEIILTILNVILIGVPLTEAETLE